MGDPPTTMDAMMQEREAEAKHHEMEAARREAAEKAREYEGVRAEVLCLSCLMPVPALVESIGCLSWLAGITRAPGSHRMTV